MYQAKTDPDTGAEVAPEKSGLDGGARVRWEDTLSLGEQQRVGLARLLFHNPTYALYILSTLSTTEYRIE